MRIGHSYTARMFTGIIELTGSVVEALEERGGRALAVKVPFKAVLGESIAVDGACVTVAGLLKEGFRCWLSPETLERTTLGRLAPGQLADFIMVDTRRPQLLPLITKPRSNVVFNLVYYATGADVATVIIDGQVVMEDRVVRTVDEDSVLTRLQERAQRLWQRAER